MSGAAKSVGTIAQAVIPSVERGIFDAHTMKFVQRVRVKDSSLDARNDNVPLCLLVLHFEF